MKQTRQAVCAFKQSILLRCLWLKGKSLIPWPKVSNETTENTETLLIEKTAISEDEKIDNLSVKNTDKIQLESTEKTPELVDEILQALSHQIIDDFESKLPTESSTKLPDKTGVNVINFFFLATSDGGNK